MFEQKKPGRDRQEVRPVEIEIAGNPATVGALVDAVVRVCVADYNRRAASATGRTDLDAGQEQGGSQTSGPVVGRAGGWSPGATEEAGYRGSRRTSALSAETL